MKILLNQFHKLVYIGGIIGIFFMMSMSIFADEFTVYELQSHQLYEWSQFIYGDGTEVQITEGDYVLDPFNGSGTTGIASALKNRKYIGIEKEKKYCDLSIKNFENLKGHPSSSK